MSDTSSSQNQLEKSNDNDSPNVDSGKENNSTVVDGSGDDDSSLRTTSDTSSSPDILNKDNEDDKVDALVHNDSSDDDNLIHDCDNAGIDWTRVKISILFSCLIFS